LISLTSLMRGTELKTLLLAMFSTLQSRISEG
jgi:hypothetical protein